jgi:hypothetical protein
VNPLISFFLWPTQYVGLAVILAIIGIALVHHTWTKVIIGSQGYRIQSRAVLNLYAKGLGIIILVLVIPGLAAGFTTGAVNNTSVFAGGGPSLYHCLDSFSAACWVPTGGSGFLDNNGTSYCTSGNINCSCGSDPTVCQEGIAPVTVNAGQSFGSGSTVLYSPRFATAPSIVTGFKNTNFATASVSSTGYASAFFVTPNSTKCTLSVCAGSTFFLNNWDNQPAALTEIFGDTVSDHRLYLDLSSANTFRIGVNCESPTLTATAYFKIQYSIDSGTTWTDLDGGTTQDYFVDNSHNCTLCPWATSCALGTYTNIPVAAKTTLTFLRVVGVGGGGAGDLVLFSQVWIEYTISASLTITDVCTAVAVPDTLFGGKANFLPKVYCAANLASTTTFNVFWIAHV